MTMSEVFIVSNRIEVEADRAEAFEAVFIDSMRTTLEGMQAPPAPSSLTP